MIQQKNYSIQYEGKACTLIERCELCTQTDKDEIPECRKTARIETLRCRNEVNNNSTDGDNNNLEMLKIPSSHRLFAPSQIRVYRSCKRTVADEEFLLVRFQVFCIVTGALAFISVRKQKAQHASLFDQRSIRGGTRQQQQQQRQQQQQQQQQQQSMNKRRNSATGDHVSIEMRPLTENDDNDYSEKNGIMPA